MKRKTTPVLHELEGEDDDESDDLLKHSKEISDAYRTRLVKSIFPQRIISYGLHNNNHFVTRNVHKVYQWNGKTLFQRA